MGFLRRLSPVVLRVRWIPEVYQLAQITMGGMANPVGGGSCLGNDGFGHPCPIGEAAGENKLYPYTLPKLSAKEVNELWWNVCIAFAEDDARKKACTVIRDAIAAMTKGEAQ